MRKSSVNIFFILLFLTVLTIVQVMVQGNATAAVVFMYHRFGEDKFPSTNIRIEQFEEQLAFFSSGGFNVLPLEEIVAALDSGQDLPDKTIGLTIDDAYLSVYKEAYPRLKKLNFPFTVFIAPKTVDDGIPAYMNWQQIKEMHANGVTFANHSFNHDYLVRFKDGESRQGWARRITSDLKEAQQRLQQELGEAPLLFAYPYGEFNPDLTDIVTDLGYTAFGQHSGAIGPLSNRQALPRFPVAEPFADMGAFKTKALSLAMPVTLQEPVNPQTSESNPLLTVTLAPVDGDLNRLTCYFGAERMKVKWVVPNEKFSVHSEGPLPPGRSRYNCTMPHGSGGRFYWFSHQWISPHSQ
jgi:biofilm PGA synthesis lipoprotein PgaB